MSKQKKQGWGLDKSEVQWASSLHGSNEDKLDLIIHPDANHNSPSGGRGNRAKLKQPRNYSMKQEAIAMLHVSTGIECHGKYYGYFSRREIQDMHSKLLTSLFEILERKVAKHLHIPHQ
ncbi:MAG: hypothetical protein AAFY57_10240 [Cyanobacteria bacterium J06642_2]